MKKLLYLSALLFCSAMLLISCNEEESQAVRQPSNYTVVLDLSDRILVPGQLDKDFYLIEQYFKDFEKKARLNLVVSSKDRFSIKIIPQKGSPLNVNKYEDLLQLYLDETDVKDKNKKLAALSKSLPTVLSQLKKEALYGKTSSDYFGVDIWAYFHDNGEGMSKKGYKNNVLILTDGYFDFENEKHVIKEKNSYTSTRFLKELKSIDWKKNAEEKQIGLMPIKLDKNTLWVVAGISGKKTDDILQTEKIIYFWTKWLKQSGVASSKYILNGAKSEMSSSLLQKIK